MAWPVSPLLPRHGKLGGTNMSTPGRVTRHIFAAVRKVRVPALVLTLIVSAALGFGISGNDVRRLNAFGDAVRRWQHDPDFRVVQREYVALGVEAMRGRWLAVPAERVVLGFRSLPGLPLYLAVNNSSAAHYRAFSTGEMSAYLHLTSEQGVAAALEMLEDLGRRETVSDAEIVAFLSGFKLPVPVVTDAGAIASVRRLLKDTQYPPRPFTVRADVATQLRRHVDTNVDGLSRVEQAAAFKTFDARIRAADLELWRTKQVSDFLGGIWAQGYGPIYLDGIEWLMRIRTAARMVLIVTLWLAGWLLLRSRRPNLPAVAVTDFDDRPRRAGGEAE
jgi:hypothetical protein